MAWLNGWGIRYPVTIQENSGSGLSDHQVGEISLQGNNPGQPDYVDFNKFQAGGLDVRFTDEDKTSLLNHWTSAWDDVGKTAKLWVEIPSLSAGQARTIYLYGDNPNAPDDSDYDNTFTKITDTNAQGCELLYHMDDNPGGLLFDTSGNNNPGTINGASWQGADGGKWDSEDQQFSNGDHLGFNGISDYVVSANNSNLVGNPDFSLEAWVYIPTGAISNSYAPILWWGAANSMESVFFSMNANEMNRLYVGFYSGGQKMVNTFTLDAWHHFVWTRIGGGDAYTGNTLIMDGQSLALENSLNPGTPNIGASPYYIQYPPQSRFFQGFVDELAVYNRALSLQEAQAHYYRRKHVAVQPTWAIGSIEQAAKAMKTINHEWKTGFNKGV